MKRLVIFASAFIALWVMWFLGFPYTLRWLEGFSFFSTLPDFTFLSLDVPWAPFRYIASFLLQFYAWPWVGALIHSLLPILSIVALWLIIRRLFKNGDELVWLAFLPLPAIAAAQIKDLTLMVPVVCFVASFVAFLLVYLVTIKFRTDWILPKFLYNRWLGLILTVVSVALSVVLVLNQKVGRDFEQIAHLEYLAGQNQWDEILNEVSVKDAYENEYKRRYALLALSETGRLADEAFRYGLSGSEDFLFKGKRSSLAQNFNMLFYRSAGMDNAAVYYAYEQSLLSVSGLNFNSMRMLADLYLGCKDYTLAKKYLDILSTSTCHRRWVRERLPLLEEIRHCEPCYNEPEFKYLWGQFKQDMDFLSERYPDNFKYLDYKLCSLLADKNGFKFYEEFCNSAQARYSSGEPVPIVYQEALLMFVGNNPDELERFGINQNVVERYNDFMRLVSRGEVSVAKRKHTGTVWAYIFR